MATATSPMTTTDSSSSHSTAKIHFETLTNFPNLLVHELATKSDPYNVSKWHLYLTEMDDLLSSMKTTTSDSLVLKDKLQKARAFVGQRSVTLLPGSYKLWRLHLRFLQETLFKSKSGHFLLSSNSTQRKTQIIQNAYETCLARLHKAPRLWLEYLEYLFQYESNITMIRHVMDRALQALPFTQHDVLWEMFLQQLASANFPVTRHIPLETTLRIQRRVLMFDPTKRQQVAESLVENGQYQEACLLHVAMLNDTSSVATATTSRHDLWMSFCNLCIQHASVVSKVIDFDAILRAAMPNSNNKQDWNPINDKQDSSSLQQQDSQLQQKLGEMEGTLWTKLADYHVVQGNFEAARFVYEEGLEHVSRVRDFSIVFDAYVKFEEEMISANMELMQEEEENEQEEEETKNGDNDSDWDILLGETATSDKNTSMADMELALARAEHLTSVRRPLLLNRVLLKQNPHNVGEWLKRVDLYLQQQQQALAVAACEEALQTIQAKHAVNGSPSEVVLKFTQQVYKDHPDKARSVYRRVCQEMEYKFVRVEDLAQCFASWVELELSCEAWDEALSIIRAATTKQTDGSNIARNLYKSLQLWDLLLDLEESLGTVQTTKDAYNRALDLKVATPMHVLNYCDFLKDQKYYEESFAAFERGLELFAFPHASAKLLWSKYLKAFVERYSGTKMERLRDLFTRCLESCPSELSAEFYMMLGELEEQYGLTKRALGVYQQMCQSVPAEEKKTSYQLLIVKTTKYLGIPATRSIYQDAITNLQDRPAAEMCLEFAKVETSLHELDRARALYKYGSQMADPRVFPVYWKTWHDFEVSHGNEETFREMLRVKRSVQAAFSTVNYNAAEMGASGESQQEEAFLTNEQALSMIADREGVSVENKPRIGGFVQAKRTAELAELGEVENRVAKLRKATAAAQVADAKQEDQAAENDNDEIDLDDDNDIELEDELDEGEPPAKNDAVRGVSTKAVPAAVFGGLKQGDESDKAMGALERLRAASKQTGGE